MPDTYAHDEMQRILAAGPYQGENHFRMQVTGAGSTPWVNVTPAQLKAICDILAPADNTDSVKLPEAGTSNGPASDATVWLRNRIREHLASVWDDVPSGVGTAITHLFTAPTARAVLRRWLTEDDTPEPDPVLVELFERPSRITRRITYSQVNQGGADVTHDLTFEGTDVEWAEHQAVLTHEGIEVFNAKEV